MKKYLFGMLAIVLAIGFSAFTKPAKESFSTYTFQLRSGVSPTTAGIVEDVDSWIYTSNTNACTQDDVTLRACKIVVPAAETDAGLVEVRKLKSSVDINADIAEVGSLFIVDETNPGDDVTTALNEFTDEP